MRLEWSETPTVRSERIRTHSKHAELDVGIPLPDCDGCHLPRDSLPGGSPVGQSPNNSGGCWDFLFPASGLLWFRKEISMDTQNASPSSSPDAPQGRRPRWVRSSDYDPRSTLVAARYLPLVVGFSTVTAWRKRRAGLFPAPIRISIGRVAWLRRPRSVWRHRQVAEAVAR